MTAHLPDRITIDLETEGEFLTDDQPGPGCTTDGAASEKPTEEETTQPGLASRLATSTWELARREAAVLRTGSQVLRAERGGWLSAALETHAHLRVDLLNRRYRAWTTHQRSEVERLQERATELDKEADRRASSDEGSEHTGKEIAALREQAVSLRERARQIEQRPYAGHYEPTEAELERHRRRTANRRRVTTAALGLAVGWGELRIGGMLPVLTAAGITTTAWAKGRFSDWRRALPDVPPLEYELETGRPAAETAQQTEHAWSAAEADAGATTGQNTAGANTAGPATGLFPGDDGKPFPIHSATTAEMATECVGRALRIEGVPLAHVGEVVRYSWGWETAIRVSEGTPGAITNRLGALETRLDVGDGDVIVQPNRKRTAEALLRVVTGDLFGEIKPPPYRAPLSVDITDAGVFGMSADGSDLTFALAELMGEVIARSGGGKSTIIRALLDWTTAAHNAVTVFMDPSGDGPGQFSDAVKLPITHPIQIEFALLSLYRLATGRARIRRRLGMGDAWHCSPTHPAIIAFIDEFPKLTKRSKAIIAELMLVGRKEGIWIIFAAQGATKELLGSNIAEHPALKILGACRAVDTTQALGGGAADIGYLPHRLHPKSGRELHHCAQTYIVGAPGLSEDPMLHKWHYIPDDEGGRRAAERLAAGLVDVDQASIDAALNSPNPPGLRFAEEDEYLRYVPWPELLKMVAESDNEDSPCPATAEVPPMLRMIREAFEAAGNPNFLLTDRILDYLATLGPEWRQWDGKEPADRRREGVKKIARQLKKAGISDSVAELPAAVSGCSA
ncbi:ATP-binding protein [Streptomyces noursei]|uniref:ATP-binding protein n=1 Tax=Streptomyces noursei TaxID=1971 RepID=UPI0019C01172|nr:ATP-binding protein [Streptomyces noursei]MCZ1021314.1 ATP-binding protein [Streptomyces noursei]GGX55781.1 hypothetical protein GCM10010341_90620 [Streptomyces noursei]